MQCPECTTEVPFGRVLLVHLRSGGGRCGECGTSFEPIFSLRACLIMGAVGGAVFVAPALLAHAAWWVALLVALSGMLVGGALVPASLVQIRVYPLKRKRQGPDWMRRASGR